MEAQNHAVMWYELTAPRPPFVLFLAVMYTKEEYSYPMDQLGPTIGFFVV